MKKRLLTIACLMLSLIFAQSNDGPIRVLGHVKTSELQRGFLDRIDFILTTPSLAKRCGPAKVVREPVVLETISDHYPVIAIFNK